MHFLKLKTCLQPNLLKKKQTQFLYLQIGPNSDPVHDQNKYTKGNIYNKNKLDVDEIWDKMYAVHTSALEK